MLGSPHTLIVAASALRAANLAWYENTPPEHWVVIAKALPECSSNCSEKMPSSRSSLQSISDSKMPLFMSGGPGLLTCTWTLQRWISANSRSINVGVGTPRIRDLVTEGWFSKSSTIASTLTFSIGALTLESLERVVIDCSFLDQKNWGILDMKETLQPLMRMLNRRELTTRYMGSDAPVKLMFFWFMVELLSSNASIGVFDRYRSWAPRSAEVLVRFYRPLCLPSDVQKQDLSIRAVI